MRLIEASQIFEPILACAALLVAGVSFTIPSAHATVIGEDGRQIVRSRDYPWRSIGKVIMLDNQTICTGTLVGKNLVLTGAHCLFHSTGDKAGKVISQNVIFIPHGKPEPVKAVSVVAFGTNFADKKNPESDPSVTQKDFAVLALEKDVGSEVGYLEVASVPPELAPQLTVASAGYSLDLNGGQDLTVDSDCSIHEVTGFYKTDCDLSQGASGGPLLAMDQNGNAKIVGIVSVRTELLRQDGTLVTQFPAYTSEIFTGHVPSTSFEGAIRALLKPSEQP